MLTKSMSILIGLLLQSISTGDWFCWNLTGFLTPTQQQFWCPWPLCHTSSPSLSPCVKTFLLSHNPQCAPTQGVQTQHLVHMWVWCCACLQCWRYTCFHYLELLLLLRIVVIPGTYIRYLQVPLFNYLLYAISSKLMPFSELVKTPPRDWSSVGPLNRGWICVEISPHKLKTWPGLSEAFVLLGWKICCGAIYTLTFTL